MDWRRQQQAIPEIAQCIARGLSVPDEQCPATGRQSSRPQFNVLGQFLATAVNSIARSAQVAPALVGSVQDVRELIAYHFGYNKRDVPALAQGWRADLVGKVVDRLLDGELAIRITDPTSNQPLSFEPVDQEDGNRG
jgi:ribonuclease D